MEVDLYKAVFIIVNLQPKTASDRSALPSINPAVPLPHRRGKSEPATPRWLPASAARTHEPGDGFSLRS